MLGDWPVPSKIPCIGGHEGAGYIVAIGDNTNEEIKIGDPVGVKWLADSCLACEQCNKGNESTCLKAKNSGFSVDGTFQQYAVSYARHVTPLSPNLSLDLAAPIMCAGVTVVSKPSHDATMHSLLTPSTLTYSGKLSRALNSLLVNLSSSPGQVVV